MLGLLFFFQTTIVFSLSNVAPFLKIWVISFDFFGFIRPSFHSKNSNFVANQNKIT